MDDLDLSAYSLSAGDLEGLRLTTKTDSAKPRSDTSGHYVPTISLAWNLRAIKAAGYCGAAVSQAIWYAHKLRGEKEVRLTRTIRNRFALSENATRRALLRMEQAGLVEAEFHRGRSPRVTIIQPNETLL